MLKLTKSKNSKTLKKGFPNVWHQNPFDMVKNYIWYLKINVTKNNEFISNSQNQKSFLPQKDGHTLYLQHTMWKKELYVTTFQIWKH